MMTRYVIITPARDEEEHLAETIAAVASQTILPLQWVIVNDGSTDQTGAILNKHAGIYPWITALHRENRGYRQAGGGVVATFNDGYAQLRFEDWDFIVKLDADLTFAPEYFEQCFAEFRRDPKLGIGGGGIYHDEGGEWKIEKNPKFHVRGATKIYKRECWKALGGLLQAPGWDTIDELKANMLGWTTRTFVELRLFHHRMTGAAAGAWKDCIKNGRANYISGYHPLFMLLKCMRRILQKPYVLGAAALSWGFMSGYWQRIPQVRDRQLIRYTRNQQLRLIFHLESIWK
jgi:biofilm PGA synthesis N-glycosyltransferase PgaC